MTQPYCGKALQKPSDPLELRWVDTTSQPGKTTCLRCGITYPEAPLNQRSVPDRRVFRSRTGSRVTEAAVMLHNRQKHPEFYQTMWDSDRVALKDQHPEWAPIVVVIPKPTPTPVKPTGVFQASATDPMTCVCGKSFFDHTTGGACRQQREPKAPAPAPHWPPEPDDDEDDDPDMPSDRHFVPYMSYPSRCINCGKSADDHNHGVCPLEAWTRHRRRTGRV